MKIKKAIAIISTLSLIFCNLWSCSDNKTNDKSSDSIATSCSTTESEVAATTKTTSVAVQTTEAEEPTELENNIYEEEQVKIDEACIACLTEFTQMEGYNPYDYPYKYTLCDINEDGIDELIVHYMSMVGEAEMLRYYEDGKYNVVASAPESGFDICIEEHFVQFTSWGGGEARTIVEIDGKDFKQDVLLKLPEGYQQNGVDISEDEFNKLNEKYNSCTWKKPEFEDFSAILPESIVFPKIDLNGVEDNNGDDMSSDSIVGKWEAYSIGDSPADVNYGYEFYADGTGYFYNDYTSATASLTYTSTGQNSYSISFDVGGNPMEGHIENGYLITENDVYLVRIN